MAERSDIKIIERATRLQNLGVPSGTAIRAAARASNAAPAAKNRAKAIWFAKRPKSERVPATIVLRIKGQVPALIEVDDIDDAPELIEEIARRIKRQHPEKEESRE